MFRQLGTSRAMESPLESQTIVRRRFSIFMLKEQNDVGE